MALQHGWRLRLHLHTAEPNQRLFVVLPVESMSVNKQETGNATDVCAHKCVRGVVLTGTPEIQVTCLPQIVLYLLQSSLFIPGTHPSDEAGQPMSSRELPVFTQGLQMCGALSGCPRGAGDSH